MFREFGRGVQDLWRGCAFWARRPKLMLLGLVPSLLAFVMLVGVLLAWVRVAPAVSIWLTPFGSLWDGDLIAVLRAAVVIALVAGAIALFVVVFAALTLLLGAPVYERISRAVESERGGISDEVRRPVARQIGTAVLDSVRMVIAAAGLGIVVAVIGLVPAVGAPLAAVIAAVGGGRIILTELTATPCDARGMTLGERRLLLRAHRWRSLGFGLVTYLLFLIPGAAVVLMPAAVAGATMLARDLVGEPTAG
jgi:CysZ protein